MIQIKNFISKEEILKITEYVDTNQNLFVNRDDGKKISFNKIKTAPVCDISLWNQMFKQILVTKLEKVFVLKKDLDNMLMHLTILFY